MCTVQCEEKDMVLEQLNCLTHPKDEVASFSRCIAQRGSVIRYDLLVQYARCPVTEMKVTYQKLLMGVSVKG